MSDEQRLTSALRLLAKLVERLGPLASELLPLVEQEPELSGPDWERRYAQWWADLYRCACVLSPSDEEIAACAATWRTLADGDTIAMLRHAAAVAGRPIGVDDLRALLIEQ